MKTVVAIDGPSGVGKSTVGKIVARRLGLPYLDTGAMYRAVGLAARRRGLALPVADAEGVVRVAEKSDVRVTGDARTFLDGEDVSAEIRTPEASRWASAVAAIPGVRRRLAVLQRELALAEGGVLEGRDIGTKVVPETPFKFFLTADAEVRAARRHRELEVKGTTQPLAEVLADIVARDRADETRADSPLVRTPEHRLLDTSGRSAEDAAEEILRIVAGSRPEAASGAC